MVVGVIALSAQGCSPLNDPDSIAGNKLVEFPELLHGAPTGEGMALIGPANKSSGSDSATHPTVTVSSQWPEADRVDMTSLVNEAVSIMTENAFVEYATALKAQYPKVWFEKSQGFGDAEKVGKTVTHPQEPIRYIPASVVPFKGWAKTGGEEGKVKISVSPKLLQRWRSTDVVMRSCAINTMAHEISHTLSRSSKTYLYAFMDTGVGKKARRTPPASYLTGNMALCGYLIRHGRIEKSGLKSCMNVWYKLKGFQAHRCDDFPGNTPIE